MSQTTPTLEQWKSLYDLSVEFRKAECWKWMADEQIFGVRNPKTGEIGYCCIIGNLGQELGIIVYTGTDGLSSYQHIQNQHNSSDPFEDFIAQKCLSVTYDGKNALEEDDIALINALGLELNGTKAYPCFRNLSPGYFPWFITADDADFLCLALNQAMDVCLRFKDNADLLTSGRADHYLVRVYEPGTGNNQWIDQWLKPDPVQPKPIIHGSIDEIRLMRIKTNLKKAGTWEFAYAFENMPIKESGRPFYPLMLLIADTRSGYILDSQMAAPHSYQSQFAGYFLQAVEKAAMYPQEVMYEKDEAAIILQPILSRLGIKLTKVKKCKESAKARKAYRLQMTAQRT
jgi:hypothetical protein